MGDRLGIHDAVDIFCYPPLYYAGKRYESPLYLGLDRKPKESYILGTNLVF